MTGINGIGGSAAIGGTTTADAADRQLLATGAVSAIAGRMIEWAGEVAGTAGTIDVAQLPRGGDIYAIRETAAALGRASGASPAEEGRLLRVIEDVAREAAVRVYGLAGAGEAAQLADLGRAVATAGDVGEGTEGLIDWFERVRDALAGVAALAQATQPNSW